MSKYPEQSFSQGDLELKIWAEKRPEDKSLFAEEIVTLERAYLDEDCVTRKTQTFTLDHLLLIADLCKYAHQELLSERGAREKAERRADSHRE